LIYYKWPSSRILDMPKTFHNIYYETFLAYLKSGKRAIYSKSSQNLTIVFLN
jgi:hypothetical protein